VSRKQWLVVILLAIADVVVLGCLVLAMVLGPRLIAQRSPQPAAEATEPPATLPPTWTPSPSPTPAPTNTRAPTSTPPPTRTRPPIPTITPAPSPTMEPIALENATFDDILASRVPGWEIAATINWQPGDDFNPDSSYARPLFKAADDPQRVIEGTTLQIDSFQFVKYQITLYQTVEVEPGSRVQFEVQAGAFSAEGGIGVRAGIDRNGGVACTQGSWEETRVIDQASGIVTLRSPQVVVGNDGLVTVCMFAEPVYAKATNATFFDNAELSVRPPQ